MKDGSQICPLLSIARAEVERENYAACMEELCAWWLPEYSRRVPGAVVGGHCALFTLALQVWNIADK